jgi:DNA-binding CsgD family transcriptional regulator
MLLRQFFDVSQSRDLVDFEKNLIGFSDSLGFPLVNAVLVTEGRTGHDSWTYTSVGNTPAEFLEVSRDRELARRNPVNKALHHMSVPFTYDQDFYVDGGAGDIWDLQAAYGYKSGICVALHLPNGRHFLMGLDREEALPKDEIQLTGMLANLQLLAVHAQSAAQGIMKVDPLCGKPIPKLTKREMEILRWTMDGKSAWTIGRITNISENTVNFHLRGVFRKLDVSSKHQAVLVALQLGIL